MITGAAFCPQAPALVPDVGRGADAELGELRAACRTAIRRVAAAGSRIVVVGSAPHAASYGPSSRGSFGDVGVDLVVALGSDDAGPIDLPPSLSVGAWLVRDALGPGSGARGYAVATDGEPTGFDEPTALVVVGDGSARRTEKAPGYLDPRAAEFDAGVAEALRSGRPERLDVDTATAAELLAAGAPAWRQAARLLAGPGYAAELLYDAAPFGVGYFVAAWTAWTARPAGA